MEHDNVHQLPDLARARRIEERFQGVDDATLLEILSTEEGLWYLAEAVEYAHEDVMARVVRVISESHPNMRTFASLLRISSEPITRTEIARMLVVETDRAERAEVALAMQQRAIMVAVTDEHREILEAAAAASGRTISEYLLDAGLVRAFKERK